MSSSHKKIAGVLTERKNGDNNAAPKPLSSKFEMALMFAEANTRKKRDGASNSGNTAGASTNGRPKAAQARPTKANTGKRIDSAQLSAQMKEWAEREMGYTGQGVDAGSNVLCQEHLQQLCRGNASEIWAFMVRHFRSSSTAQFVRQNLLINGETSITAAETKEKTTKVRKAAKPRTTSHYAQPEASVFLLDRSRRELERKKDEIMTSVADIKDKIARVRSEISELCKELKDAEANNLSCRSHLAELARRRVLLKSYAEKLKHQILVVNEYKRRLSSVSPWASPLLPSKATTSNATDVGDRLVATNTVQGGIELETMEHRAVRNAVASVYEQDTQHNTKGTAQAEEKRSNEDPVVGSPTAIQALPPVQEALAITAHSFVRELGQVTAASTKSLWQHTVSLDVGEDARSIRNGLEATQAGDSHLDKNIVLSQAKGASHQAKALQSLMELMEDRRQEHLNMFLAAEGRRNEAAALREELRRNVTEFRKLEHDDTAAEQGDVVRLTMRKLQNMEMKLRGQTAALRVLKAQCRELTRMKDAQAPVFASIQRKEALIRELEDMKKTHEAEINQIIRQNMALRRSFDNQRDQILSFVRDRTRKEYSTLTEKCAANRSIPSTDLQLFQQYIVLPLAPKQVSADHSDGVVPVSNLALNRFQCPHALIANVPRPLSSPLMPLQRLLSALDFPWYKGADQLLPFVYEHLDQVDVLRNMVSRNSVRQSDLLSQRKRLLGPGHELSSNQSEAALTAAVNAHIAALVQAVADTEVHQTKKWVPQYDESVVVARTAVQECAKVKALLEEWWKQPAQFTTPWLKVEGKSLQDWLQEYHALTTELNRLKQQAGKAAQLRQ